MKMVLYALLAPLRRPDTEPVTKELVAIAWGMDYDLDSYDSNAVVQAILLGEVVYG